MSRLLDLIREQKHQRSGNGETVGIFVLNDEGLTFKTVSELSDEELETLDEWFDRHPFQPGMQAMILRGGVKMPDELTPAESSEFEKAFQAWKSNHCERSAE
jgi:hypothetical protein